MSKEQNDFEFIKNNKPEWAKAIIVAELIENDSDVMRDYFDYHVKKRILLGFSKSKRNSFSELRKFAKLFNPTQELAENGVERREDKYYLVEDGKYYSFNGWKVRKDKCNFNADCEFYKNNLMQ